MKEVTYEDWAKNPVPRNMWVWDSIGDDKVQRKVIYFIDQERLYPVITLTEDEISTEHFKHCAEIEKSRRMTNKELSRWLREKPTREYNYKNIDNYIYCYYEYKESCGDEEVPEGILIRENDGEWREPLIEVTDD